MPAWGHRQRAKQELEMHRMAMQGIMQAAHPPQVPLVGTGSF
jgi:hypothetical protein